jgi:hypothetical protein
VSCSRVLEESVHFAMELEERANLVALHGAGDAGTAAAPGNEIFDSHGILLSMLLTPPSQARSLPAGSGGVAHCLGGLHLIDLMHVFLAGRIRAARGDLDPPRLQSLRHLALELDEQEAVL